MFPNRRIRRFAAVGFVICLWAFSALAHRLDECLQASFVSVEPDRIGIEVALTPGVEMIGWILPSMDLDHDGVVSESEAAAFGERVGTNLSLRIDDKDLPLRLADARFPEVSEMTNGVGVVRLHFLAEANGVSSGRHHLRFENRYLTNYSVYLANALVPESPAIAIGRQERDALQTRLEFDYTLAETPNASGGRKERQSHVWPVVLALAMGLVVLGLLRRRRFPAGG
jgi:hypothetical protein